MTEFNKMQLKKKLSYIVIVVVLSISLHPGVTQEEQLTFNLSAHSGGLAA